MQGVWERPSRMSCRIFWGMRKRNALIAVFVLALALTWPVYSLIRQARRDAAYRTAIAPFQRDLHIGMSEAEVKRYLNTRHIEYPSVRYGGSEGRLTR